MTESNLNDLVYGDKFIDGWRHLEVDKSFPGGTGTGDTGTVAIATVTGTVKLKVVAICSVNMAGATATIELGTTGQTAGLIAQTTATDLDAGEIWHDATPDSPIEASSVSAETILANGLDIFVTVGTANLSAGTIKFIFMWKPLSRDGIIVAA